MIFKYSDRSFSSSRPRPQQYPLDHFTMIFAIIVLLLSLVRADEQFYHLFACNENTTPVHHNHRILSQCDSVVIRCPRGGIDIGKRFCFIHEHAKLPSSIKQNVKCLETVHLVNVLVCVNSHMWPT